MGKVAILLLVSAGTVMVNLAGAAAGDPDFQSRVAGQIYERWSNVEFVGHYSFEGDVFEDNDLSGMACASETRCLVGADEGKHVQVLEVSKKAKSLRVITDVVLLDSGSEIDIEAIASENDSYYITGSHGVSKKDGKVQKNRYKIFRFRVDPATGLPAMGIHSETHRPIDLQIASLSNMLKNDAVLGPYFQKPVQQNGVNIEGLAVRDGQLYVGFRSPNIGGICYVMEIAADEVFAEKQNKRYRLHSIYLGKGYGIREIVAAQGCFLIIAGNSGSEPSDKFPESANYRKDRGYVMFSWDGKSSRVHRIGPIKNAPGKAEAMVILSESEQQITVLILFDGADKGNPSVYRIS